MAIRQIPIPPSSNLAGVSYDDETRDLYIAFVRGNANYVYRSVPAKVADGFSNSGLAAGAYFRANILNQYEYERQG